MKNVGWLTSKFLFSFVGIFLLTLNVFSASYTTYQARIIKPDGYPLEANNVNFKFTILDQSGTCILYSENYSAVNMTSTGGMVSFSLGSGVKSYPTSSSTFIDIFSNGVSSHSCDAGGPPSYSPGANDTRKIVMQFHDGSGWQTLPAMSINAVPYAMYANDSQKLGGVSATSYVRYSTIPTCGASEALQYTGTSFNCVALPSAGTFSAGDVATALNYTPANAASFTTLNSVVGNVSSTVYAVSSTLNSLTSNFTSLQNSVAVSFAAITSSQWVTSGSAIHYNSGNVVVSGGLRISMDSAACSATLAGTLRYNAGAVEYCNGVTWSAFGVSGAGLQGLNGSVSGTQSFANGSAGNSPGFVTNNGVHTLNIPQASAGSVTGGLISNTEYSTFMGKIASSAASIAQVLGFTPADSASLANYLLRSNNLSDLTSSATARTNLGVGYIGTLASVNLGSADVSGTLAIARTPSYTGDVTKAAASSSLILSNTGVTAGTYSKVTVDAKGRVTSSTSLSQSDITTALGFTPASNTALGNYLETADNLSDLASSATARTNLGVGYIGTLASVDLSSADVSGILAIARTPAYTGDVTKAAASSSLILSNTGVIAGTYAKVTVDAKGRVTSSSAMTASDINTALGYTAANSATVSSLNSAVVTSFTAVTNSINAVSNAVNAINESQWTTSSANIYYNTGNVGVGTSTPTLTLDVSGTQQIVHHFNDSGFVSASAFSMGLRMKDRDSDYGGLGMVYVGANRSDTAVYYGDDVADNLRFVSIRSINPNITLVESMRITGTGNVGIGVVSPTAKLELAAGTTSVAPFKITSGSLLSTPQAGAIEYNGFDFLITDGAGIRRSIATATSAGALDNVSVVSSPSGIALWPAAGNSVTVSATTASTNSQTGALIVKGGLGVAGNIYSSGTIITSSNIQGASITAISGLIAPYIAGSTNASGNLLLDSTTHATKGNIYLAQNGGNVGIGTASASGRLTVVSGGQVMNFGTGGNTSGYTFNFGLNDDGINFDTSSSIRGYNFKNANGILLKIAAAGNVGIGTSNPTGVLHIVDNATADIRLENTNTTSSAMRLLSQNGLTYFQSGVSFGAGSAADIRFTNMMGTTTWMAIQAASGNVGIGTTGPTQKLDVNGGIRSIYGEPTASNVNAAGLSFDGDTGVFAAADGRLNLWSNNTRTLSLYNSNVGIGTSAPTQRLDVSGTAKATNFMGDGSLLTNISAANLTYYDWPSTVSHAAFSTYSAGVTGFQDYTGTAVSAGSMYWSGITSRDDDNTGSQFMLNWNNGGSTPSGFKVRTKDDNIGDWGTWRDVAFIDATVAKTGDTMTGALVLPSNGLKVGVDQLVVSGTYVGIGTPTPDSALNIVGGGGGDDDVHIDSYGSAEGTVMLRRARGTSTTPTALQSGDRLGFYTFRGHDGASFLDLARMQSSSESDFTVSATANLGFFTSYNGTNTEKLRISASGAVGVGTSTPTAGYRMDVFGDMQVGNGGASQTIRFRTANTDGGFIRFNSSADTAGSSWLEIGTTDNNDEPITFTQSGLERMRIHTNGGVGIGTNAPAAKLEVRSPTTGALTAFTQSVTNAGILIDTDVVNATHGPGVFWKASNSSPTKPKAGVWMYQENGPGSWLLFGTSNSYATGITNTAMAIDPSGYVGIGTTTPQRQLHVNGDAYVNAIMGGQNNGSGNFHLDAWTSGVDRSVYLNWAGGTGGAKVGNGSSTWGPIGASAFNTNSDGRMKENIKSLENPLEKILKFNPVSYTWKDSRRFTEGQRIGLIAQDVEKIYPQAVRTDKGLNSLPGGTKLVNYSDLVSPVIGAIKEFYALWFEDSKELHQKLEEQKRQMASVQSEVEMLKEKSQNLEQQNKMLKEYLCAKDPSAKICK